MITEDGASLTEAPARDASATGWGTLFGIGVGPGDPELLTLKAVRLLREVPVVCAPCKAAGAASYALAIVEPFLDRSRQEVLELVFPMNRDDDALQRHHQAALQIMQERLCNGLNVALLTEGDPALYSTFAYVCSLLQRSELPAKVEIVPGVGSPFAAAAAGRQPLVLGEERLAIMPATGDADEILEALRRFQTVVLLKVAPVLDHTLDLLARAGLSSRTTCFIRCGTSEERIVTAVESLRGKRLDYFSLFVVRQ